MKIGIISDTHNYLSKKTIKYLSECDEIWHAGDIGSIDILNQLHKISSTRAVFGNIDGDILRREIKEYIIFNIESIKILMIHIAGRIESYNSKTRSPEFGFVVRWADTHSLLSTRALIGRVLTN